MKKLIIVFTVILSLLWQGASSQNLIVVQNGGNAAFYTNLDAGISDAMNGDTLYIPGGIFNITVSISKCLHIIGVGHNFDTTSAAYPTYIFGEMQLDSGASNGSINGVYIPSNVNIRGNVNNYRFDRCRIGGINSASWDAGNASWIRFPISNVIFTENIIGNIFFGGGQFNSFCNNIMGQIKDMGNNNIYKNNIFLVGYAIWVYEISITNSTFENNIFFTPYTFWNSSLGAVFAYNTFNNNIFLQNINFPYNNTNFGYNNFVNQNPSSIFVNQNTQDYHLQSSCPGKNAGTDGTDIGIYGGIFPWKDGGLPSNPHILSKIISSSTDSTGNLNVNIKVAAQDH